MQRKLRGRLFLLPKLSTRNLGKIWEKFQRKLGNFVSEFVSFFSETSFSRMAAFVHLEPLSYSSQVGNVHALRGFSN